MYVIEIFPKKKDNIRKNKSKLTDDVKVNKSCTHRRRDEKRWRERGMRDERRRSNNSRRYASDYQPVSDAVDTNKEGA